MNTSDYIRQQTSGAAFYRADLHIHSFGGSHDVSDELMTPENIVATAANEKLSLIAVTDHNSIVNVAATIEASSSTEVVVVPGVELSTPEGHLLVYFRDEPSLARYFSRLDIEGIDTQDSRCQNSMLDCLNRIGEGSGFAILAHVDAPGGLEFKIVGNPPHKVDILCHPALQGIELRSIDSDISYSDDDPIPDRAQIAQRRRSALKLGSRQSLARTLFSDSHALNALGRNARGARRVTRLKMDSPSYDSLRIALTDADARVRIEDDVPEAVPYVLGIHLDGGFLDGTVVHFSTNLNCIIGGRGTGKSTLFEAVRCISQNPSPNKLVDSEAWADSMRVVWMDETGELHTIERRINEEIRNLDDSDFGPLTFPIACYGQSETAQTSQQASSDPSALQQYLDQFIEIEELLVEDEQKRVKLLNNQTDIEKADLQAKQIPDHRRALAATKKQLEALEKAKAKDVVELERKIAEERGLREGLVTLVDNIEEALKESNVDALVDELVERADSKALKVGDKQFDEIVRLCCDLKVRAKSTSETNRKDAKWFADAVSLQIATWKEKEKKFQIEVDRKRKELAEQGVKLDLKYIRKLAQDETSLSKKIRELEGWQKTLAGYRKERRGLLTDRKSVRDRIATVRESYARQATSSLKGTLGDLTVSVKVIRDGYSLEAEALITEAMGWRTVQVPRAALLAQDVTVPKLIDAIRKADITPLRSLKTDEGTHVFTPAESRDVLSRLGEQTTLFALERCEVQDRPRITVTKAVVKADLGETHRAVSRDFSKLSLGQQQSVLLSLMLSADKNYPLIIDQPEDNLDSEFIYHSLVPVLRRAKERRQVIVVTHNANIAVLGDAEQIVALKSVSDKGSVMARGSIDDIETRRMACQILEGSEEAFRRRANIYGLG